MITYSRLNNRGRLGNQLFQIASTIGMADSLGTDYCFPEWEYQHCFKNPLPECGPIYPELELVEKTCGYQGVPTITGLGDVDVQGYFQSEKYFSSSPMANAKVKKHFEFSDEILKHVKEKYSSVLEKYDTTVHVRRGDYASLKDVYHNLSHLYYFRATALLAVKKTVVFSDDIEWCKNIFKHTDCFFVSEREHDSYQISYTSTAEQNAKNFTLEDVTELALMSMFKNNIIANSTFSWWAAWLNKNPEKIIIAPSRWFTPERAKVVASPEKADGDYINDIIPETWTKI